MKVVQEAKPAAFGNRPELPLAPMAPGQKAEVNDADANMELMEGEDEEAFKHSILRQRHKRTSQKNPITESMRVEQATKQYLAQIGLTWPLFQKEHRRPKAYNQKHFVRFNLKYVILIHFGSSYRSIAGPSI